jgi:hypothetical protein
MASKGPVHGGSRHGEQLGHLNRDVKGCRIVDSDGLVEMLIFDEAERLSMTALEFLRDVSDRTGAGVILIGMPGMEKRLSRFPQLYSRIDYAHHYRPLQGDELSFVLTRHWRKLGLPGGRHDRADYRWQFPTPSSPVCADRAHP